MKIIISILLLLTSAFSANSQTLDSLINNVKRNNLQIIAMQKWLEVERTKARTGIYPDNPELSYIYLWGNSEAFGNQQEFEFIQSFKMPGYYSSKSNVQHLQLDQKELLIQKSSQEILHKVRVTYFDLVWLHKKVELLQKRKGEAEKLVSVMDLGFQNGEISKPAYDKARIYNMGIRNELQKTITDIEVQKSMLKQLNGDFAINSMPFEYPVNWDMPKLDSVLTHLSINNLEIRCAQANIKETEMKIKLEQRNNLPTMEAGYKSEAFLNQKLKGIHAGLTIPLWQNKNRIKQAKLENEWSQASYQQVESLVRTEIITLYNSLKTTYDNYVEMREILGEEQVTKNNIELLQAGQISFPEFLMEIQFMFESQDGYLETEKEYYNMISELILKSNI
jgi:cobalt-zinc-cadmium efflux system outer membrane protein